LRSFKTRKSELGKNKPPPVTSSGAESEDMMKAVTVKYQIGTYSGTISVDADENDDNEAIFARAKRKLNITLPMYYQHFEIIAD